jgi:hypothetical protein
MNSGARATLLASLHNAILPSYLKDWRRSALQIPFYYVLFLDSIAN